jgi:steroid 5-alpha reductase family enzyme
LDLAAAAVVLGAVGLAFAADEQLRAFRRDPANRGRCIEAGLWAHSRHPNYLGEVGTWWGLWLFALAAGTGWWWTGIGAAAITVMFVFVSVPMMEKRALATRAGYGEYRTHTPMLVPRLRRRPETAGDKG